MGKYFTMVKDKKPIRFPTPKTKMQYDKPAGPEPRRFPEAEPTEQYDRPIGPKEPLGRKVTRTFGEIVERGRPAINSAIQTAGPALFGDRMIERTPRSSSRSRKSKSYREPREMFPSILDAPNMSFGGFGGGDVGSNFEGIDDPYDWENPLRDVSRSRPRAKASKPRTRIVYVEREGRRERTTKKSRKSSGSKKPWYDRL